MSSYKKYLMIGVTTILLPLGKLILQKVLSRHTEESEQGPIAITEENEEFTPVGRRIPRRA